MHVVNATMVIAAILDSIELISVSVGKVGCRDTDYITLTALLMMCQGLPSPAEDGEEPRNRPL